MWTSEDQEELAAAVEENQRAAVKRAVDGLILYLQGSEEPFDPKLSKIVMQLLRRKRFFDEMVRVGDALVQQHDQVAPMVKRQYAQALIEKGELSAALAVLEGVLTSGRADAEEDAEVRGLIGRVHKQRYVAARVSNRAQRARTLNAAVAAYHGVYQKDKARRTWHGINVVALARRAERDGVPLTPAIDADALAREILVACEAAARAGSADAWASAITCEAYLALGDLEKALQAFKQFEAAPRVDAFECSSYLRQLEEVWQLREDGPAGALVVLARAGLLRRQGGETHLGVGSLQSALDGVQRQNDLLERAFGGARPLPIALYQRGLERARSVARVETEYGEGFGTGFVVQASELFGPQPALADELVLLTNAHVIGLTYAEALRPDEAFLRFDGIGDLKRTLRVKEILFESPVEELDTTVLRLDAALPGVDPLPLAPPEELSLTAGTPRRLYVIGYPEGGPLTMSMEDCFQVGWKAPRLHYRTPTQPGSSGSPVFDEQWRLVGIHHSGDEAMPRLDGDGVYEANEGIWIHSIKARTALPVQLALESGPPIPKPCLREGVFVSYSHRDKIWLKRLQDVLAPVVRHDQLKVWDDEMIRAGAEWEREIEKAIESAQVAVLLVTQPFLASEFIAHKEFPRILEANRKNGLTVIWVPVSAALVEVTPLGSLQAAIDPARPLDALSEAERNQALVQIARQINAAANLGRVKNALTVADHIALQVVGMGGTARNASDASASAQQQGRQIDVTARDGRTIAVITADELTNLPPGEQQLIKAKEEAMRRAYERYTDIYPDTQARDAGARDLARLQSDALRREVCGELNQILDFVNTLGKQLEDHYNHVRFLCR
jgi:hypothetical protein